MNEMSELALSYACPSCAAAPGEWCRTFRPTRRPPGDRATWLHSARTSPIYQAYSLGSNEGWQHGVYQALNDPERARARLAAATKE